MRIVLGIGHESGVAFAELVALADDCLKRAACAQRDLDAVASIESRRAVGLVVRLAQHFGVAATFYPAARLELETPRLLHPSEDLFRRIGCHGVAEAAALAAAGPEAVLVLAKQAARGVTCAIAARDPNRG
ncbi:cobalt-precorrin 5A hydrolase/precorrin-3B C17-methyltransferase/cobalt-precorrin 5A hydrolase/precorrin-3B C17-methyltransferase [Dongia mobilis]|uniref:Cobalt-precorrin 5A hydrolase/precorrin-3B C17-methyltransferase/cobalt-precorrin 5A hydrolase/precorrin-3B C17-methyltransferase n=1 Tax=Dongia mobilis TaxID=578943 RepID=A0A4R6WIP2_9PROT|nr:cobalamin biosynthesis protein [Dongia mobilis]TDQ78509.1 cobalt-precorrin 5A hydrolase/precorrin-3B C17-methyltransferase/cobalt-precorrin 5A hydrolase/precorrin-3B C17-methyltransferase [Dongia mobilis]